MSRWLSAVEVVVFQKRMHLSAVPPPDASRPCWCGDHAMALTAAVWSENFRTGLADAWFQMYSWLSLPPDAICLSSGDHFSPHTCTHAHHISTPALPADSAPNDLLGALHMCQHKRTHSGLAEMQWLARYALNDEKLTAVREKQ